jgi:hypothetical protein
VICKSRLKQKMCLGISKYFNYFSQIYIYFRILTRYTKWISLKLERGDKLLKILCSVGSARKRKCFQLAARERENVFSQERGWKMPSASGDEKMPPFLHLPWHPSLSPSCLSLLPSMKVSPSSSPTPALPPHPSMQVMKWPGPSDGGEMQGGRRIGTWMSEVRTCWEPHRVKDGCDSCGRIAVCGPRRHRLDQGRPPFSSHPPPRSYLACTPSAWILTSGLRPPQFRSRLNSRLCPPIQIFTWLYIILDQTICFYTSFMVYMFNILLNDSELPADSLRCIGEYKMEKCHLC